MRTAMRIVPEEDLHTLWSQMTRGVLETEVQRRTSDQMSLLETIKDLQEELKKKDKEIERSGEEILRQYKVIDRQRAYIDTLHQLLPLTSDPQ